MELEIKQLKAFSNCATNHLQFCSKKLKMNSDGLNLDLLARVLSIRWRMKLQGQEPVYKLANGIKYTVKVKEKGK